MANKLRELRDAPAYLEYASSVLAKKEFRAMSLQERGLLYSIKLECWVNKAVPADPEELAPFVNQGIDAVTNALTDRVKSFLRHPRDSPADYESIDIEIYRQSLEEKRGKQSEGGKKGAAMTNAKHLLGTGNSRVTRDSLNQTISNQINLNQSIDSGFVKEYMDFENG